MGRTTDPVLSAMSFPFDVILKYLFGNLNRSINSN